MNQRQSEMKRLTRATKSAVLSTNMFEPAIEHRYRDQNFDFYDLDESNEEAIQLYNSPSDKYDGVKSLWSQVILFAAEYAKGEITNDHDCKNEHIKVKTRRSAIRFLSGKGDTNLNFACQAAGIDIDIVKGFSKQYEYILNER